MNDAFYAFKRRYVVLDSLRGVCACMVVLLHFVSSGYISAMGVVKNGFLFVDFFFVLSGFVIASSYGARLAAGFRVPCFLWLRLARIYPLHLAVLIAFIAFELFLMFAMTQHGRREPFTGPYSFWALMQSLLLVQIFFGADSLTWNGPSWSIAAEIWTYLIFALAFRYAWRWVIPICACIILLAPLVLLVATDRYMNVVHDGALMRCLYGFALGVVAWRCSGFVQSVTIPRWVSSILELAMVAAVVGFVSVAGSGPLSLAAPLLFFGAVLLFSREGGVLSHIFKRAPFVVLGGLSYSIYMIHTFLHYRFLNGLELLEAKLGWGLVVKADGHTTIVAAPLIGDAMVFLFLAIVIACSYLTYRFIELPGQAVLKRFFNDEGPVPLPVRRSAP